MIHPRTLYSIEFHRILERLAALCVSSVGKKRALSLSPLPDAESVTSAAQMYEEAKSWALNPVSSDTTFSLRTFPDVTVLLEAVQSNPNHLNLDLEAFWALREVLRQAQEAHLSIAVSDAAKRWPHLLQMVENGPLPKQLIAALLRCISDDGLLRDESSPELFHIRTELRHLHQNCIRKVKDYVQQYNMLPYLQDEFITLSSDRYVLPVKATYKRQMQGIIHDWSQTGETCYFEPMFLLEINNRLQGLKREERDEERKILKYLQELLVPEISGVQAAISMLTQLDVMQAARRLADMFDGRILPLTDEDEGICLLQTRHPLLMLNLTDGADGAKTHTLASIQKKIHPLDIIMRPGERILIITGGNAGGKTVCLKTLGLVTAMTLCGLPVPVGLGSHVPWFNRMDAFIGDEQSLADNVSTFTAQIEHLSKAWKYLDHDGLVLLDEFGAGTDPAQGAALAQAVLDGLLDKHTFVLAVTHFPSLKIYALTHEGAKAASMLFDPKDRKPLFKLAYDQVGASLALDVAREHGLPEEVLLRAKQYLLQNEEDSTALIDRLNILAIRREKEIAKLVNEQDKVRCHAERKYAQLEKERIRLQDEIRHQISEIMRAWKEDKVSHKLTIKELSCLRNSLLVDHGDNESSILEIHTLFNGQKVLHKMFNKLGVITEIDEKRCRVRLDMHGVSLWASVKDICLQNETSAYPTAQNTGAIFNSKNKENNILRLDIRGKRTDEALLELEHFLDKALLNGFTELEIVHGRGTGTLRRHVHNFLHSFPAVERFAIAPENNGGDGMTIVLLR